MVVVEVGAVIWSFLKHFFRKVSRYNGRCLLVMLALLYIVVSVRLSGFCFRPHETLFLIDTWNQNQKFGTRMIFSSSHLARHQPQITSFSRLKRPPTMADRPPPGSKHHGPFQPTNTIQPSTTPARTIRRHRRALPGLYHRHRLSYPRRHHTDILQHFSRQ